MGQYYNYEKKKCWLLLLNKKIKSKNNGCHYTKSKYIFLASDNQREGNNLEHSFGDMMGPEIIRFII